MATASDQRDGVSWVVLELTRQGELRVEEGTLPRLLRDALDADADHPVFIPSTTYFRDGTRVTTHLMEGYAFVATGLPEASYYALARECPYVRKVLAHTGTGGIPVLQVLSDETVQEMAHRLRDAVAQDVDEGMQVRITQGTYRGLTGEVVLLEGDDAAVYIELRSFKVIRTIPRIFLEPVGEGDDP